MLCWVIHFVLNTIKHVKIDEIDQEFYFRNHHDYIFIIPTGVFLLQMAALSFPAPAY
jgi:hypothetical protein